MGSCNGCGRAAAECASGTVCNTAGASCDGAVAVVVGFVVAAEVAAGAKRRRRSWLIWSAERRLRSIAVIIYIIVSHFKNLKAEQLLTKKDKRMARIK